jgi:hypothetical protein
MRTRGRAYLTGQSDPKATEMWRAWSPRKKSETGKRLRDRAGPKSATACRGKKKEKKESRQKANEGRGRDGAARKQHVTCPDTRVQHPRLDAWLARVLRSLSHTRTRRGTHERAGGRAGYLTGKCEAPSFLVGEEPKRGKDSAQTANPRGCSSLYGGCVACHSAACLISGHTAAAAADSVSVGFLDWLVRACEAGGERSHARHVALADQVQVRQQVPVVVVVAGGRSQQA